MQTSKPATGHDVDMHGPAQLVPADRSGRRLSGSRADSLGICVMITAQMLVGVRVSLYVHVPAADQGHGLATALGHALTSMAVAVPYRRCAPELPWHSVRCPRRAQP
jgi:hypothetical protein